MTLDGIIAEPPVAERPRAHPPALTTDSPAATIVTVRDLRRAIALLVLGGLLAPVSFAIGVALHLSAHHPSEHRDGGDHDDAAFSIVWHGHSHASTTPEHDHPALRVGVQAVRIPTVVEPSSDAPVCWAYPALSAALAYRVWRLRPPGLAGVGPPSGAARLSILRI